MEPLVTIICISYNHGPYIKEALNSVFAQSYSNIEIIILDDASSDNSEDEIRSLIGNREIEFISHPVNEGYTKTFNQGLASANGDFIVDFALDDVMLPDFIQASINALRKAPKNTGIVYSNADYIDDKSAVIGNHKAILLKKKMVTELPSGDIFEQVLRRYFICTPTMMIKRSVFDRLEGYDDALAYEDFDFWVRSSRYWEYTYLDEVHLQKRKLKGSMSASRYRHHQNEQLASTLKVCKKAFHLCKTNAELKALNTRLNYEYRQCLRNEAKDLASAYLSFIQLIGGRLAFASLLVKYLKRDFQR